ncbi:MAG: M56 family metallopeptidase, partial [Planctomycetota bacterium]
MTGISEILRSDSVYRLGWALLHSLWQIALLASIVAVLLVALRRRSANLRYLAACGALAAPFILLVATYCLVPGRPAAEAAAGSMPPGSPQTHSVDPVLPDAVLPRAALSSAPPPEFVPSTPSAEPGVLPLARQPSPEATPSVEPAMSLPERVSQAISPWVPWLVLAWFVGVFLLSVWHLGGWIALQRLKYLGTTAGSEPLARRLAELVERMQLGRPVRIFQSALVDVPAVIGWLRPVLLVPAAMLGAMSPQQIDAVLAHELAHIRRYDYLVNLLQTIIETLLFYHPAVWWLSRRIRLEREHCCDDAAVAVCGNSLDYAAALMAMEQGRMAPRLAVAARGGTALSRVRRVLNVSGRDPVRPQTSLVGVFTVVAMLGLLAGYIATAGEQPQSPDQAAEEGAEEEAPGEGAEEPAEEPALPADLKLEARVVGIDGKTPQRSSITFWKAVDPESLKKSDQGPGRPGFDDVPHVWRDRATGKTWKPIHSFGTGDRATKEGLEPGDYRVTAFVGRGSPTMLAVSDPVQLRGSRKHTVVTMPIQDGPSLKIEVVDAQTGKPLEYAGIRLVRSDGLPVVRWSSTWSVHPRGDDHTFEHLAPGKYTLEVFKRA